MTDAELRETLSTIKYPGFSRDIVSFGLVQTAEMRGDTAHVALKLQTRDPKLPETIFKDCHAALDPLLGGPEKVKIDIQIEDPPGAPGSTAGTPGKASLPGVKKIIAVASGKGGVGKSTVAANLAIALSRQGLKVGLCDCDLYGPSVPLLLGVTDQQPYSNDEDQIIPIEAHGLKMMSMGFLLGDGSPVIVRGPLANRYTQQFLRQVAWGELDVLVLDLPPGTGDIQLTIVQTVALDGSIIVTTPQEMALIDARKAATMFAKVNVPILGIVENMAWFECEHGTRYHLFGKGGGEKEAARLQIPLLAQIPLEPDTRAASDEGRPVALLDPDSSSTAAAFHQLANTLRNLTSLKKPL